MPWMKLKLKRMDEYVPFFSLNKPGYAPSNTFIGFDEWRQFIKHY